MDLRFSLLFDNTVPPSQMAIVLQYRTVHYINRLSHQHLQSTMDLANYNFICFEGKYYCLVLPVLESIYLF